MAYIKQISVKSQCAVPDVINYITNPQKSDAVTCINCYRENISENFKITRLAFRQDKGILAHHFIQSFDPSDNITPEQAHQMAVELMQKVAPNYQCIISTHVDKDHIHNHIVLNSCNLITGYKWHSNKATLKNIRAESDRLCKLNGIKTIEKKSKYQGIDQATYFASQKGTSWKTNLVKDLDEALNVCNSKENFISFLKNKDYSVRYTDTHITFTKNGEKKGIRANNLAKQFGTKYTKENLEKKMGYYVEPTQKVLPQKPRSIKSNQIKWANEWERYEQWNFTKQNDVSNAMELRSIQNSLLYTNKLEVFTVKLLLYLLLISQKKNRQSLKSYKNRKLPFRKSYRLKQVEKFPRTQSFQNVGNIKYTQLVKAQGNNFQVKIPASLLSRLMDKNIFFSGRINKTDGTALITIKEKDKNMLAQFLGIDIKELEEQNQVITNQNIYTQIKRDAQKENERLEFLVITPEQLSILQENFVEFAYFKKDTSFNIAFRKKTKKRIRELLFNPQIETEYQRNCRINSELKELAEKNKEKLRYKLITADQYQKLKQSEIKFATFPKDNMYNMVYLESAENQINNIIYSERKSSTKRD